jgi:hypothetical protein
LMMGDGVSRPYKRREVVDRGSGRDQGREVGLGVAPRER